MEAYPLHWPDGWPRHQGIRPVARFDCTFTEARRHLVAELARMGARHPVISTNVELRLDGLPRANQPEPADPGVAVYFERKGRRMIFACDRWSRVRDNIRAIAKTLEAMRGIERWGASDMMERAYSAFEALPAPRVAPWWEILGVSPAAGPDEINAAFRERAKRAHPDLGGDAAAFAALQRARREGLDRGRRP